MSWFVKQKASAYCPVLCRVVEKGISLPAKRQTGVESACQHATILATVDGQLVVDMSDHRTMNVFTQLRCLMHGDSE